MEWRSRKPDEIFLAPQALAGTVGKWESWCWISTFPSSRRWAFAFDWFVLKNVQMAVAVGMWKSPVLRFPSVGGNVESLLLDFHGFHPRAISTAIVFIETVFVFSALAAVAG